MPALDEGLFRRWGHSREEDHDGVLVYRPADFDFPRARGRDGIEFRADGSYVDWVVGPGDARQPREGSWRLGEDGKVRITTSSGTERVVELLKVAPDQLELQPRSEP